MSDFSASESLDIFSFLLAKYGKISLWCVLLCVSVLRVSKSADFVWLVLVFYLFVVYGVGDGHKMEMDMGFTPLIQFPLVMQEEA